MRFQRPDDDDEGSRWNALVRRRLGSALGPSPTRSSGAGGGVVIGATMLALVVLAAACGSSSGSKSTSSTNSVASRLVMGGPQECPTRITCLKGLEQIYGLHFKDFKALDAVGPISVAALSGNDVQVVRLDSSDPSIQQNGWVILQDDKHFQQAGNIIPVMRNPKAVKPVKQLLNKVSKALTQADLGTLNKEVTVDHMDPADAAKQYVQQKGLNAASSTLAGQSITIGSADFSENVILAYIYADALKAAGDSVTVKAKLGSREILFPALESGQIDMIPEYAGNVLTYLNPKLGSLSLVQTVNQLRIELVTKNITALLPSAATDSDAIVVTKATASKYHLVNISDLGKSA